MIITKVTVGFVAQVYDTEKKRFTAQDFVAGESNWEDDYGTHIDPDQHNVDGAYLAFDMVQPMVLPLSVSGYEDLRAHVGHDIVCVIYGDGQNVAIECETCGEVLIDFDEVEPCKECTEELDDKGLCLNHRCPYHHRQQDAILPEIMAEEAVCGKCGSNTVDDDGMCGNCHADNWIDKRDLKDEYLHEYVWNAIQDISRVARGGA